MQIGTTGSPFRVQAPCLHSPSAPLFAPSWKDARDQRSTRQLPNDLSPARLGAFPAGPLHDAGDGESRLSRDGPLRRAHAFSCSNYLLPLLLPHPAAACSLFQAPLLLLLPAIFNPPPQLSLPCAFLPPVDFGRCERAGGEAVEETAPFQHISNSSTMPFGLSQRQCNVLLLTPAAVGIVLFLFLSLYYLPTIPFVQTAQREKGQYGSNDTSMPFGAHASSTTGDTFTSTQSRAASKTPLGSAHPPKSLVDQSSNSHLSLQLPLCRALPGADTIVVSVLTSATEAYSLLPAQLLTLSYCAPNLVIFSDLEQTLGLYRLRDALSSVSQTVKDDHADFQLYRDLKAAQEYHGDMTQVPSKDKAADLGKWKYLPSLHETYTLYPNASWYVTIKADTYLSWFNLVSFLNTLDAGEPHYFTSAPGSAPAASDMSDSTVIFSHAAMSELEAFRDPERVLQWEELASLESESGPTLVNHALTEVGVTATNINPFIQFNPFTAHTWGNIPDITTSNSAFTAEVTRNWCAPVITWPRNAPHQLEAFWHFEQTWLRHDAKSADDHKLGPYRYKDVYRHFVGLHVHEWVSGWDNLASDRVFVDPESTAGAVEADKRSDESTDGGEHTDGGESTESGESIDDKEESRMIWESWTAEQQASTESAENCKQTCLADPGCMQWAWNSGRWCAHHWSLVFGGPVPHHKDMPVDKDGNEIWWGSGWVWERVKKWQDDHYWCPKWEEDTELWSVAT